MTKLTATDAANDYIDRMGDEHLVGWKSSTLADWCAELYNVAATRDELIETFETMRASMYQERLLRPDPGYINLEDLFGA